MNIFNDDFLEFIQALNASQVQYLLVGGYSVIIHGYSRTTGDLDIWVKPDEENYHRLMNAFSVFHLPTSAISMADFLDTESNEVFTFGRPPMAIDLLTTVKGLEFDPAFAASALHEIQNTPVRVIQLQDLITAKKAAGRYRDLDDIENLRT